MNRWMEEIQACRPGGPECRGCSRPEPADALGPQGLASCQGAEGQGAPARWLGDSRVLASTGRPQPEGIRESPSARIGPHGYLRTLIPKTFELPRQVGPQAAPPSCSAWGCGQSGSCPMGWPVLQQAFDTPGGSANGPAASSEPSASHSKWG